MDYGKPVLRFRSDNTFTIAMFGDLHLKEDSPTVFGLIHDIVKWDDPDIIVINGDAVHRKTTIEYAECWRLLINQLEATGLPWMYIYGNHEYGADQCGEIDGWLNTARNCLYEHGPVPAPAYGNYTVPVLASSEDRQDHVAARLWALNYGINDEDRQHFAIIKEPLLRWMKNGHSDNQNGDRTPLSLAFSHFPLKQFKKAWKKTPCTGYKNTKVGWQLKDADLFETLSESVDACFASHDHGNDFEGRLNGIRLSYGRCSSLRGQKKHREEFSPGARIIRLREGELHYATHVRLQDGSLAPRPIHEPADIGS